MWVWVVTCERAPAEAVKHSACPTDKPQVVSGKPDNRPAGFPAVSSPMAGEIGWSDTSPTSRPVAEAKPSRPGLLSTHKMKFQARFRQREDHSAATAGAAPWTYARAEEAVNLGGAKQQKLRAAGGGASGGVESRRRCVCLGSGRPMSQCRNPSPRRVCKKMHRVVEHTPGRF